MAEIRVEPRRKPIWPWILVIVVIIAALAWWLYMRHTGTTLTTQGTLLPTAAHLSMAAHGLPESLACLFIA
jgi:hypothetical protein